MTENKFLVTENEFLSDMLSVYYMNIYCLCISDYAVKIILTEICHSQCSSLMVCMLQFTFSLKSPMCLFLYAVLAHYICNCTLVTAT